MNAQIARAWDLLEVLTDPEIPVVTLRELGILRDVREGPEGLDVVITRMDHRLDEPRGQRQIARLRHCAAARLPQPHRQRGSICCAQRTPPRWQ